MRGPTWRAGIAPHLRTLKLASCFVLARHCRLTISAAFTNMTRFIQRVMTLAQRSLIRRRREQPDHPSCSQDAHGGAVLVRCAQ